MAVTTIKNVYPDGIGVSGTLMISSSEGNFNLELSEEAILRLQCLLAMHNVYKFPEVHYRYEFSPQGCSILPRTEEQAPKA